MIEIIATGALATVQDHGRGGALKWGVGASGALDNLALAAGNILLGNDEHAAGVEIQIFPFQVRFLEDCAFAITGADCGASLDDLPLPPWWVQTASVGQILSLGIPRQRIWRASRAYLCLAGGVDVPLVLGSRSTQLRGTFGGLEGRPLRSGDRLRAGARANGAGRGGFGLSPPALDLPLTEGGLPAVRVLPAAEYAQYTEAAHQALWNEPWRVTPQSDRYGYRLDGAPLHLIAPIETRSHGIVPGVIQVPPNGQPIVQMRDAQPSGGYPKIGVVIEADLWRLGQAPIGSRIRFRQTSWDEAIAAGELNARWLAEARRLADLYRGRTGSS
ncbi:biotin-dependent carboxyltransferase family protein [Bradyrhizobium canariense]|uniref:5-oxoprolinase subunit C family protein n=1 Tax=Bradyrhizobium canariense TaxID=255045 RepID=UPI001C6736C9|nr:biotin-dependent carboxyltransferase family protein [Bradyrhizobium canariense]MBW5440239.1 biotin-dependent carboxyltransferase family protein [Bradyrhizobium canariense]